MHQVAHVLYCIYNNISTAPLPYTLGGVLKTGSRAWGLVWSAAETWQHSCRGIGLWVPEVSRTSIVKQLQWYIYVYVLLEVCRRKIQFHMQTFSPHHLYSINLRTLSKVCHIQGASSHPQTSSSGMYHFPMILWYVLGLVLGLRLRLLDVGWTSDRVVQSGELQSTVCSGCWWWHCSHPCFFTCLALS